jgi:hypothetical protein
MLSSSLRHSLAPLTATSTIPSLSRRRHQLLSGRRHQFKIDVQRRVVGVRDRQPGLEVVRGIDEHCLLAEGDGHRHSGLTDHLAA